LDEIEKAHPDVFNLLLQVLDDGMVTDSLGRKVDFKNTIIIMTSNMGSSLIQERFELMNDENADEIWDKTKMEVGQLLKKTIRPEFLNRIDEIIMFKPLSFDEITGVVDIQMKRISKMLKENGISLELTPSATKWIARAGFDPQYGARPLKRAIQKNVLNLLSREILAGTIKKDQHVVIDVEHDELKFTNTHKQEKHVNNQ
jgi:ATP-dependent Clp protease ATP-binding subunit ClpB